MVSSQRRARLSCLRREWKFKGEGRGERAFQEAADAEAKKREQAVMCRERIAVWHGWAGGERGGG